MKLNRNSKKFRFLFELNQNFKIVVKGFKFYLYGSVNPWVLLASGEVKKYSPDEIISGKTSIGEKVNVLDDLGNEVEGIIVASPRGSNSRKSKALECYKILSR